MVYKDLNSPSKSYGCSPFFVEPAGVTEETFCTNYTSSCYCTETCVSDFSQFCGYSNYIPGTQEDFTIKIDSNNSDNPQQIQIAQWTETESALSESCEEIISEDVELEIF